MGDLPPLLNPAYKINYHDRFKGMDHQPNSRSYDGPAIRGQRRLREELSPNVMAPKHVPVKSMHPAMQIEREYKEVSLQERIRLINEANTKKLKINRNSPVVHSLLDRRQAPLPPVGSSQKPKETLGGIPQSLPPVSSRPSLLVPKKSPHIMQPPEWWG